MSMKSTYGTKDNYNAQLRAKSMGIIVVCVLLSIISILPLWILVCNATRTHMQISTGVSLLPSVHFLENYQNLMDKDVFKPFIGFKNSFIISAGATLLSVFFSALTAYGLVVYDFKIRDGAYTFILAVLMIPAQVSGVGFMKFMIKVNLYDTLVPLILPAVAAPAVVFFMRQYLKSSFPLDIVEASRIDGCGEFRTFLQIGIPMMKPAIAVQAIFAFIQNWNNYFTPSMMIVSEEKKTLPLMIKSLSSDRLATDYGIIYCGIAISIIPLVVIYLILSRFIIEGVALGGVKE
ncbi:MAG: carbohydrate ABC transporter permease [Oscillospiraceae bacterium]